MGQMGKNQQLNRNFSLLSMIAFSLTLLVMWEAVERLAIIWKRSFALMMPLLSVRFKPDWSTVVQRLWFTGFYWLLLAHWH